MRRHIRSFKGRKVKTGDRVFVYRNLHEKCWSVKDRYDQVAGHANDLVIDHADLVVQGAGRLRVLRERRKNVHAGVRGVLASGRPMSPMQEITYNPFRAGHFYWVDTGLPVEHARQVHLDSHGKAWATRGGPPMG